MQVYGSAVNLPPTKARLSPMVFDDAASTRRLFPPRFACENFSTESRCDTVDFSRCLNLSRRVNVGLRKYLRDQHEKRTGWKQETLNFSAKLSDFEVSRKLPLSVYIYLRRDGMLNLQNGFPLGT